MKYFTALVLISLFCTAVHADEIYKWVDENGKVHYGDVVPDQYKENTQEIKKAITVVEPEAQVKQKNTAYAEKLKREQEYQEYIKRLEESQRKNAQNASKPKQSKPLTREQCRDRYVKRTAYRTACFDKADNFYGQ